MKEYVVACQINSKRAVRKVGQPFHVPVKKLELLGKNDCIDHVDDTIAGGNIRGNDVGSAAIGVGKNTAALGDEATLQGADA